MKMPSGLRPLAPSDDVITKYDRMHFQQYVKLLDALAAGKDFDEMCECILKIDPTKDRAKAHRTLESHIKRARWISDKGFRQI